MRSRILPELVAVAAAMETLASPSPDRVPVVMKSIMHPKKWKKRQARTKMQKASRRANRA